MSESLHRCFHMAAAKILSNYLLSSANLPLFIILDPEIMLISRQIFLYGVIISTGYGVVTLQGLLIAFIGQVFRISLLYIGHHPILLWSCCKSLSE